MYQPAACPQKTFEAAERAKFPLHHLMFEVTEKPARDVGHLQSMPAVDAAAVDALHCAHQTMLLDPSQWPEKCFAS